MKTRVGHSPSCGLRQSLRHAHDVRDRLAAALTPYRNSDAAFALATFLGRFWSMPARLLAAFPIDRRELADHAALGLTEARVRGAIRTLEEVGFLDRAVVLARPTGRRRTACTASRCCSCSGLSMDRCSARPTGGLRRPVSGVRGRGAVLARLRPGGRLRGSQRLGRLTRPKARVAKRIRCLWAR